MLVMNDNGSGVPDDDIDESIWYDHSLLTMV